MLVRCCCSLCLLHRVALPASHHQQHCGVVLHPDLDALLVDVLLDGEELLAQLLLCVCQVVVNHQARQAAATIAAPCVALPVHSLLSLLAAESHTQAACSLHPCGGAGLARCL